MPNIFSVKTPRTMPSPCSATEGAAELQYQVADGLGYGDHAVDALLVFEADKRTDVEAAHAGMAVVACLGVVVANHLVEASHVLAEAVGVDCGVFHVGQWLGIAVDAHQQAQACAADSPNAGLLPGVGHVDGGVGQPGVAHAALEIFQLGAQLFFGLAVELHQQQRIGLAFKEAHVAREA